MTWKLLEGHLVIWTAARRFWGKKKKKQNG
jgi:hypothetical protein